MQVLKQLMRRVMLTARRAVLTLVDDAPMMQVVQVEAFSGETIDRVERFQNYGMTSVPLAPNDDGEAEAALLALSGNPQHSIIVAVDDRRYRVTGLEPGEVCLYTDLDEGGTPHRILMKRGREIEMRCGGSSIVMTPTNITITADRIDLNP